MSDKFNGFSQDEINRVSGNKHKKLTAAETMKPATFRGGHGGIRRMPDKSEYLRQQKMSQIKQPQQTQVASTNMNLVNNNNKMAEKLKTIQSNDSLEDINLDRSMSKSLEEALFYQPQQQQQQHTAANKAYLAGEQQQRLQGHDEAVKSTTNLMNTHTSTQSLSEDSSILKLGNEMDTQISSSTLDDSSILPSTSPADRNGKAAAFAAPSSLNVQSPFKGISLKDFESHRKMIEEQNRQKKEMLYKAIEQHSQKTAAEARKIEEIKAELAKLDNDLAVDVALLRKQIDNACIHFATVEKQYMKIESQFLKAKIDLHNAAEKKELLTEHLCTVIAHNEDRKAQKLTELMEKVGLATNGEYEAPTSTSN
ncbi:RAB6-interacting golgin isoform X2 [Lucilia sericata]|uniref:RAB6-interacting golgin isoform X1 n=1 Tax=Lucilia sericata TaxID=13632 RepID=UPI0018A81277|nr:RAB6-interacting golgin isoform X1 [Lucilia sericata]XP_037821959.1 RAB6-interacting golgin isoform X2 [Lucilia sericata]